MTGRAIAYQFFDAPAATEEESDPLNFNMM